MSETIYKYVLEITDSQNVSMPCGAVPLTVQAQYGKPCLWVRCDPSKEVCLREVQIHPTGTDEPIYGEYVGTVQTSIFVWHVFMLPEMPYREEE